MCRIAGIISAGKTVPELNEQVEAMCRVMRHGGPDDAGIYVDEENKVCFGHRRLALIDLSSLGHQPMSDSQKRCWVVFNGEIYNYKEIKSLLTKKGHLFNSHTDTEVILAAYLEWGVESFKLFNGMFAFALYDPQKQSVFLVRDAAGIKPLYYHITENGELYFASEVKAFKQTNISWPENPDWQLLLLCFGHIPEPYTTLQDVYALNKGHYLKYDINLKSSTVISFRKLGFSEIKITEKKDAVELIHETLTSAVKRHLISDAPIGLFLSGGIDSSLLTLLAAETLDENLHTLSVTFNDHQFSEQEYQQAVIENIHCNHTYFTIEQNDLKANLDEIILAYDQPSNDGINTWFISKCAHESGLKAVLSGQGSDETFGGYPSFNRMSRVYLMNRLPAPLIKTSRFLTQVPLQRLSWLQIKKPVGLYLTIRGLCTPNEAAELSGINADEVIKRIERLSYTPQCADSLPEDEAASWFEFNMYMQNQLLKDSDYMSMKHGLELRVPFLDQDFLDAVFSISPNLLYKHNGLPKQLLIDSFKDVLPEKIWNRKKMGFSFPFQKWLGSIEQIRESVSNIPEGKNLMKSFDQKKTHWSKIWAYYLVRNFNS